MIKHNNLNVYVFLIYQIRLTNCSMIIKISLFLSLSICYENIFLMCMYKQDEEEEDHLKYDLKIQSKI